jgi:hypothetical protein
MFSCLECKPKEEKIKELNKLLILIENAWDNKSHKVLESLIERERELTKDAEV